MMSTVIITHKKQTLILTQSVIINKQQQKITLKL